MEPKLIQTEEPKSQTVYVKKVEAPILDLRELDELLHMSFDDSRAYLVKLSDLFTQNQILFPLITFCWRPDEGCQPHMQIPCGSTWAQDQICRCQISHPGLTRPPSCITSTAHFSSQI